MKKDMYLVPSKHLTFQIIFVSIIHNGSMFSSPFYPMKFLKPFLPYETLSNVNIFLTSISFISTGYLDL